MNLFSLKALTVSAGIVSCEVVRTVVTIFIAKAKYLKD